MTRIQHHKRPRPRSPHNFIMATKTPSGRRFTFTLHNWTQTDWEYLLTLSKNNDDIEYLKVAQETGSEGESPHLQGCVIFGRSFKQRPPKVSKILILVAHYCFTVLLFWLFYRSQASN
jgi:hypothetical protein